MVMQERGREQPDGPDTEPILGRIASRAVMAARHTAIGATQVVKGTFSDAITTVDKVLRDVGALPEATETPEEQYQSRLEFFEATIRDRVPFMEDELSVCPEDFTFPSCDELEWHIYGKVRDTIGFSDGLHWLRMAAEEENPGLHVETPNKNVKVVDWLHGRIEDYSALLMKHGLRGDTAQLLNIGLHTHCRLQGDEYIVPVGFDGGTEAPRDPMAC